MPMQQSVMGRGFTILNYSFLIVLSLVCVLPLIHVFAISLSSSELAAAGAVKLWPQGFNWHSYEFVLQKGEFFSAFFVSVQRVLLGTFVNMLLTILVAYPLSKESSAFFGRTAYAWFFVFTILFSGGLIPWYMTIKGTGIMDSLWALVLPGALPVFNAILLLNFFRGIPKALEEAAFVDGAGHQTTLWRIFIPLSKPALATITLFAVVGHWNAWFDGLILMNSPRHYPLQSYLQTVMVTFNPMNMNIEDIKKLSQISNRTLKAAQIFLAALPILLVYPFLQKYFVKGIVLGSVKG
ncbi:carbohydrate ABC transporter permease [Paenibacillus sp. GCM10027626]|uniref:carbohydrate ABC transporter permease n=1 Tax=Paenibacillus sp. GCM10027626 TaxID=3273411 RepID=UPI00363A06D5